MSRFLALPAVIATLVSAAAQDRMMLEGSVDDTSVLVRGLSSDGDEVAFQASWRFTDDGVLFDLVNTTAPETGRSLALDRLIEAALGAFLDAHLRFQKHGVIADDTPDRLLNLMNAMAWAAEDHFGASGDFPGFEAPTRDQLIRVCSIDWSQARFGVGGDDQDKYLAIYRYLRLQRQELERQLRADLLPLAAIDALATNEAVLPPGRTERINSTCGTVFDQNNFLCALDLAVSDSSLTLSDARLGQAIATSLLDRPEEEPAGPRSSPKVLPVRKRDRWLKSELDAINARIDQQDQRKELWAMRDRLDDLQGQIDDLRMSMREKEEQDASPVNENPIAALSALTGSNVTIRFERYSSDIDPEYLLTLNEVFEQLARSPQDRVLITGYTDRSGDPATNLRLSEQRAKAVRNYLLQRGIDADRLMVNFYGDSQSDQRDPSQRRVEIEWLR